MKDCRILPRLIHDRNNCYLNAILVGLFHEDNNLQKYILGETFPRPFQQQVQIELRKLQYAIKTGETRGCQEIRRLFDVYTQNSEWLGSQQEPYDVVNILTKIFEIPNSTFYSKTDFGIINGTSREESSSQEFGSFVISIEVSRLRRFELNHPRTRFMLCKYVPSTIDKVKDMGTWNAASGRAYTEKTTKIQYKQAPFLYIHVNRIDNSEKQSNLLVVPDETIVLEQNSVPLTLTSILLHKGLDNQGHYTCLYRCGKFWYVFDDGDLNGTQHNKLIGTFTEVLDHPNTLRRAVDFMYV